MPHWNRPYCGSPNARLRLLTWSRLRLIQVLLKAREDPPDLFRPSQVSHRVGDGVPVLEPKQGGELLLVELFDAYVDVVRKDEVEEDLLLAVESALSSVARSPSSRPADLMTTREG